MTDTNLDKKNMFGSLQRLGKQVEQIAGMLDKFKLPADHKKVNSVVVSGMGGSGPGAHLVKTLFADELKEIGRAHV